MSKIKIPVAYNTLGEWHVCASSDWTLEECLQEAVDQVRPPIFFMYVEAELINASIPVAVGKPEAGGCINLVTRSGNNAEDMYQYSLDLLEKSNERERKMDLREAELDEKFKRLYSTPPVPPPVVTVPVTSIFRTIYNWFRV